MNISIEVTPDEQIRIQRAAKFSRKSVKEFTQYWITAGVEACERDYIIDPRSGEIIGDRVEIEGLEREVLRD